jgi:hypothetical protein
VLLTARWRWDLNPRKTCAFTRFRVLRTTVRQRPWPARTRSGDSGERWRTGVNDQTEPTAWSRRAAAGRPGIAGQCPVICRREPVSAEPGSGRGHCGNQQDLSDSYEAGSLVITDSDCMADCGPSLIAPNRIGAAETCLGQAGGRTSPRYGEPCLTTCRSRLRVCWWGCHRGKCLAGAMELMEMSG